MILENHLHFISTATEHAKRIQQLKSFTARQLIDLLKASNAHYLLLNVEYQKY